jgi:hypothetical protein
MAITKNAAKAKAAEEANIAPATEFAASGAVIEPSVIADVDMKHPSVDDNPRKGTTVDMNRIDFNEPSGLTPPEEVVEKALKDGE